MEIPPLINAVQSYPNVKFRNVNCYDYAKNTPAERWIENDEIFLSPYFVTHLSDFLRLVSLYKFGGIYFDLDFVVLKKLKNMPPNFAGDQGSDLVNNAVIGLQRKSTEHRIAEMFLRFGNIHICSCSVDLN